MRSKNDRDATMTEFNVAASTSVDTIVARAHSASKTTSIPSHSGLLLQHAHTATHVHALNRAFWQPGSVSNVELIAVLICS